MVKYIVYTSNTGYTKKYAELLSERLLIPAIDLKAAKGRVPRKAEIIYMGWIRAGGLVGYGKVKRRYDVRGIVGVCLGASGSQIDGLAKRCRPKNGVPIFTVQGGMDRDRLTGINKSMIDMLVKMLRAKDDKTEDECKMLEMIENGGDFFNPDNLDPIVAYFS